ncbi:peroxiredoxin [[Eubacterium] cellulosolvens]
MKRDKINQQKIKVGDLAPVFTLLDQNGNKVNLNDLIGKKAIVLYFYPHDDTPGCKAEACAFRDQFEVFQERGAEVIGVSSDSVGSHRNFQQKYNLPFTILSDTNGKVRQLYGVPSTLGLLPGRVTYIIDRKGIVRYVFSSQFNAKAHVNKSLEILLTIDAEDAANKPLEIKI